MKTLKININIPTNKEELKSCLMNTFGWITHKGRMKNNHELLNELCRDICSELNSGYWNKDISDYMRKRIYDLDQSWVDMISIDEEYYEFLCPTLYEAHKWLRGKGINV